MASYLRRCVALGVLNEPSKINGIYDYRAAFNACLFKQSNSKWIRFWFDWPAIQPSSGSDPAASPYVAALDDQIRQAKANGLRVVITPYRFPTWTNTTPHDEAQRAGKTFDFRIPESLTTTSAFGRWMQFLMDRYGRFSPVGASVDFMEVCNEPNIQMWPQRTADGAACVIGCYTAQMFQCAQALARRTNPPIITLAGPGMADQNATNSPMARTPYPEFMENLFYYFPGDRNFQGTFSPDQYFAFTTHNYTDVLNRYPNYQSTRAYNILFGPGGLRARQWRGWPYADYTNPYILITEGGADLNKIGRSLTTQADLVDWTARRMYECPGVGMVTNYLMFTVTDPTTTDTGLREVNGAVRPVWDKWRVLPSSGNTLTLPSGC